MCARIVVVELRADVEIVVVVEQIDFGALVGRRVLDRRGLMQIVDQRRGGPNGFVELAVDDGPHLGADHPHRLLTGILERRCACASTAPDASKPSSGHPRRPKSNMTPLHGRETKREQ